MRLALYQAASPAGDLRAGERALHDAMGAAKQAGCDLLVMPELFLPGYAATVAGTGTAAGTGDDRAEARARQAAMDHELALVIGLPVRDDGGLRNMAVAFGPDGACLARYAKIQLFGDAEAAAFARGDRHVVFDYRGVRFGLLVCYDVEFPEHVRALKRLGAEVILVPTANMMPFVNVNQIIVPARAAENAVTIVYANYCGSEGGLTYNGLSGIFGPDGYLLAGKGQGPGLCVADLPGDWREHGIPLSTQMDDLVEID